MSRAFELSSSYSPAGDQPRAIEALVDGLEDGLARQILLGVTGYSIYTSFGPNAKVLADPFEEHED